MVRTKMRMRPRLSLSDTCPSHSPSSQRARSIVLRSSPCLDLVLTRPRCCRCCSPGMVRYGVGGVVQRKSGVICVFIMAILPNQA